MRYTYRDLPYPENLIADIYCDPEKTLLNTFVDDVLKVLTERERHVIELRYEKKLTNRNIGIVLGVSLERIRQITTRTLRRLRHPTRLKILEFGELAYANGLFESKARDEAEHWAKIDAERAFLSKLPVYLRGPIHSVGTLISHLDLSVRGYNCLVRHSCNTSSGNIQNVGDLLDVLALYEEKHPGKWRKLVRGMGVITQQEVEVALFADSIKNIKSRTNDHVLTEDKENA